MAQWLENTELTQRSVAKTFATHIYRIYFFALVKFVSLKPPE